MRHFAGAIALLCCVWVAACAQDHKADADAKPAKVRVTSFLHVERLPLATIVPRSATARAETRHALHLN
jgi:hypothetical protein